MVRGTPRVYFLELTKSILVMFSQNVTWAEAFFWGYGIQVVTGSRYFGGFVGMDIAQALWLEEKIEGWRDSVSTLDGVARWNPQTAYAGLQKSLPQEWGFFAVRHSGQSCFPRTSHGRRPSFGGTEFR